MTYIKNLVMQGFKSFPKKTEVPFTPGINVVLGPNGSGKSNISDAICFVLGRLSIKSMRAAKAANLIFMGAKSLPSAKEASVEITFDNSNKTFGLENKEIKLKRILRKKGQSIYKINGETKTRQEVLNILSQAGIDPHGFNIILQGGIQNFVRMQPEERRKVIEEVSGISIYELRKEKSLKELSKTEDKLKEINSILRERTSYLNNLEKERQQALKYKKLESDLKKFRASIVHHDLTRKIKEEKTIESGIENRLKEIEKSKKNIEKIEKEISDFKTKIDKINLEIQKSTGFEQEKLNREIANLRAELAGMNVNFENYKSKLNNLMRQKSDLEKSAKEIENTIKDIQKESPTSDKKAKEIEHKKKKIELLEKKIKNFYMAKSEINSVKDRIRDKESILINYDNESEFLIKQIENISLEVYDKRANPKKLDELKKSLFEKKEFLNKLSKREMELEKMTSINESEIENMEKLIDDISKLDVCPVCKNKVTPEHMKKIQEEIFPKKKLLEEEVTSSDRELEIIYQKKEILLQDIESITQKISKTESDINKITNINEKKNQIKSLYEKNENLKKEIFDLKSREKKLEVSIESNSNLEKEYETLKMEVQEISLRTREMLDSEVDFKQRELDRIKISLKQNHREEEDVKEKISELKKIIEEKEKILAVKRKKEEEISNKFKKMISEREAIQSRIRNKDSELLSKRHSLQILEGIINELKIEQAKINAEKENLEIEMKEFEGVEIIRKNREFMVERLIKIKEILSNIGNVNLRSLEVYDSIKKEYDSIKEKAETVSKEKEGILKIIHEIDVKKKRVFVQTLKNLNEIFSRNFSQLSVKGLVFLELDNKQDPFAPGSGVQIVVKAGHGKYFDVRSLSGGEQTLVALSLIFAIQEYKPYHFYLFDEIDAALDKKNSERLAELLKKYMQKGQYIITTHNDEVISRATNIYGVSMQEGVSKIVSLKV